MRTAQTIEENKESSTQASRTNKRGDRRGMHGNPKSVANLRPKPWPKGVSGNPGGKPGYDVAAKIAQTVFEENQEAIYHGLAEGVIAGNAYSFDVLANRAFGKMKETLVHEGLDVLAEKINKLRKQKHGRAATDPNAT